MNMVHPKFTVISVRDAVHIDMADVHLKIRISMYDEHENEESN